MKFWIVCLPVTLMLAGCTGSLAGGNTLERIQADGVIRVGYANEAPFAYMDTQSGRLTGEAPEVARAVMEELGVSEIEGVLTEFGSLIPGLKAGRFDMIAAGMYITPERCEQIAFSNPTYSVGEAFIVKSGNPAHLHSYKDVAEHPSARLGVVAGTVELGYARDLGIPRDRTVVFPDPPSALAGLEAGRIEAFAGTALTVQDLLTKANSDKLERAEPFVSPIINGKGIRGYGAFGFRKSDVTLVEAVNDALKNFLGTPEHKTIVEPFGFTETELPGAVTAAELCTGRS